MEWSIWKVKMTVALDGEPGAWDCSSFDFLHPQMRIDPFPTFAVMRESSPVHWDGRAHWVFRYDDARSVLLGDEFGRVASAFQEQYFESLGAGQPYEYVIKRMTYLDREDHQRVRALFAQTFTPRRIESLRPFIADLVNRLLDRVKPGDQFDLLDVVAHPVPSLVICELLGVPTQDRALFDGWTQRIAHLVSPAITEAQYADAAAALAAANENPTDVVAVMLASDVLAAGGDFPAAFTRLIDGVRVTTGDDRVKLRERLLELFEVVGPEDPSVARARSDLANALF